MNKKNNFAEARLKEKFTQEMVAKKLKVAKNTISQWENNKRQPDNETLLQLAQLYNCSVDYLLARENNKDYKLKDKKEEHEKIEFKTERFTEKQKEILQYVEKLDDQQCKVAKIYFRALLDDFVEVEQTEGKKEEKN